MTRPRLGFIGLGAMGAPMTRHLLRRGYTVNVWARAPEKITGLIDAGAQWRASPRELAAQSDVILLCVFDAASVNDVVFGDDGIAAGATKDKLLIDHTTTHPAGTREMATRLKAETGMGWIDAPVSGGVKGALAGTLIVMAGGDPSHMDRVRDIASAYAKHFTPMGPVGAGQASKVCNQMVIGATVAVWAEALNFAHRFGVNAGDLPDCLAGGWADSAVAQDHAKRMAHFAPETVGAGLMQKDMDAALDIAGLTGCEVPVTTLVADLYRKVYAQTGEGGQAGLIRLYTDEPFATE